MDSHGGWLASVLDLARISRGLDASKAERLLGRRSLRRLWARPSGLSGHDIWSPVLKQWYASGWHVRIAGPRGELEQWHGGRLPGSASRWVRQADGVQWIVLFNQDRGRDGILLPAALEPRLREALSRVSDWPELDLFEPR
jgi:N-acyl-D-amino-acid deacylase